MSRLYTVASTVEAVAEHFGADPAADISLPSETTEGHSGLIVTEDGGHRMLRSMHWGFPRLTREMRERGEDPGRIGLVADLTNPMWEHLVVEPCCRCLIPLTHFANPDGDPGEKTRTWFSVKDAPLVAWAGFFNEETRFGAVYAGMTMTANALVEPYNERMPALLMPEDQDRWLHGDIRDVIGIQFRSPIAAERMEIRHTDDGWRSGKLPPGLAPQFALF